MKKIVFVSLCFTIKLIYSLSTNNNINIFVSEHSLRNLKVERDPHDRKENITCTRENCDSKHGQCLWNNTVCYCASKYANVNLHNKEEKSYCLYERKKISQYFLFEMLLGLGIGHLKVGNNSLGIGKCVIGCLTFLHTLLIFCLITMKMPAISYHSVYISGVVFGLAYGIWHFVDFIKIVGNSYTDGNGVKFKGW